MVAYCEQSCEQLSVITVSAYCGCSYSITMSSCFEQRQSLARMPYSYSGLKMIPTPLSAVDRADSEDYIGTGTGYDLILWIARHRTVCE